ncbi:hypothetical protein NBO_398g0007 [Nosema bombycis CQ1]|uniref:Uncharacterized protein n=1 Tax=Nosema bombycis (strain CQ1 / CVCC 102059) TaxID=578461 RepID=R0M3L4_NOSB1|nr:hypothetical protein NBO_398g0007 [Nosema bombycis CQ1]|eukprot:EOB12609.1 hypothetical protein NBO_398g0007 [Nosema bombycis CQ1]
MLSKGDYTILEIISVSRPLSTLKDESKDRNDVYKAIIDKDNVQTVVYLLGNVDFGKKSIISLNENKENVLLYPDDYVIKKKEKLNINKKLIENLLKNKK